MQYGLICDGGNRLCILYVRSPAKKEIVNQDSTTSEPDITVPAWEGSLVQIRRGLMYADPTDPQSLNLYSYARNSPLTLVDPTGLHVECTNARVSYYNGCLLYTS